MNRRAITSAVIVLVAIALIAIVTVYFYLPVPSSAEGEQGNDAPCVSDR